MSHDLRIAWVIARRDYVAAVFSRLFVLFLILPVALLAIAAVFGAIGAHSDQGAPTPTVVRLHTDQASATALLAAREAVARQIGDDGLPELDAQDRGRFAATLAGSVAAPRLVLAPGAPDGLPGQIETIVAQARAGPVTLRTVKARAGAESAPSDAHDRVGIAKAAQYAVLVLSMMLAGRLLSSFIEERGNKVIEILAASVPVDAIFLGKLIGMLLFSLTCVAAWGGTALAGVALLAPGTIAQAPVPALGWPLFAALALVYFSASYLLLGAIMLGLGAQATSPADVQTLALPTTMAQLLLFGLASVDVARPDHWVAYAAAVFPWSSALAMIARAAEQGALWPHLLAIAWQAAWLALTIRVAAARFRRAVLKSGPVRRRRS